MPIVGWMMAGVDFSNYFVQLGGDQSYAAGSRQTSQCSVISYGMMINAVINFLAVAWFVFWIVKGTNKLKKRKKSRLLRLLPTPEDIVLLREIRDSLKNNCFSNST